MTGLLQDFQQLLSVSDKIVPVCKMEAIILTSNFTLEWEPHESRIFVSFVYWIAKYPESPI